jgi:hypothetical protein
MWQVYFVIIFWLFQEKFCILSRTRAAWRSFSTTCKMYIFKKVKENNRRVSKVEWGTFLIVCKGECKHCWLYLFIFGDPFCFSMWQCFKWDKAHFKHPSISMSMSQKIMIHHKLGNFILFKLLMEPSRI